MRAKKAVGNAIVWQEIVMNPAFAENRALFLTEH
jgi:hypothetical protein